MELIRSPLRALGRMALAGMFITGGAAAFREPGHRVKQAAELGIKEPELAVRANGAAMVAAGVALAVGYRPRAAAAVLAGLLVPTTLAGHAFWKLDDPAVRHQQEIQFFKNLSMFGGALMVVAERPKP
jgi:putative oxidoreductase